MDTLRLPPSSPLSFTWASECVGPNVDARRGPGEQGVAVTSHPWGHTKSSIRSQGSLTGYCRYWEAGDAVEGYDDGGDDGGGLTVARMRMAVIRLPVMVIGTMRMMLFRMMAIPRIWCSKTFIRNLNSC